MSKSDFDSLSLDELDDAMAFASSANLSRILTPAQRIDAHVTLAAQFDRLYAKDPWRWMVDRVVTIDEASQKAVRWPDKPYLHDMVRILEGEQMVAFPKSRRVMASWTVAAWATHKARYEKNHAIFFQSETEDKSAHIVSKRCAYIEDNQTPEINKRTYASIRTAKGLVGRMEYRLTGSTIWAVPQGADALRAYTPSVVVLDESEFQQEAQQALVAAIPFVEKAGKLVLISSSNGPLGVIAGIAKELGWTSYAVDGA